MSRLPIAAALLVAAVCSAAALVAAEGIDFSRIHVVDGTFPRAALFRGNNPLVGAKGNESFAYDELLSYLRTRAAESNVSFPTNNSRVYLVDISFENIFDKGYIAELAFWNNPANAPKGRLIQWLLAGAPVWATAYTPAEQDAKIQDGTVWKLDQIPERVALAREMLRAGPPAGYEFLAVYGHCAAGRDRTGEFMTAYRLWYEYAPTLAVNYQLDIAEAGRAPNYFSTGAIGWACLTWNLFNATAARPKLPDCLTAYKCELFKACEGTGV